MVVTHVTRWGFPETKCTRCYSATLYKLLKNAELILTQSTIYGWVQDYFCTVSFTLLQDFEFLFLFFAFFDTFVQNIFRDGSLQVLGSGPDHSSGLRSIPSFV